jgi:nitrogen fixation protein NifU and related proteins
MYSKKVMKHFKNPKNVGEIKNPDGLGKVGNPVCGDVMWIYIKVKNNKITNIKFKTFGCVSAIATTSMLTELAKGKTLEQAEKITRDDVAKSLGGLPSIKMHCSNLAADALKKAIENYRKKKDNA